ncbi:hypothetical protein DSW25_09600 [Sulfitobacter donghicola DSW-25 = KCTC 12864 = JCM 14565]|uniref:Uncharacterized protein n=1 Tax=Sulfitobacter donghicola DSW-25 = KCTC 12864 = JCM 14565 TaxID=1300350 RepID=A0A073IIQ5_9RHOB|nr:hypothetical protein DSW25_09600 [Sulfitobacter donghicola DSW-25 = KCTC 12864 = JCM 14565]
MPARFSAHQKQVSSLFLKHLSDPQETAFGLII